MESTIYKISELSKRMFWDVDMLSMDWELHSAFILERVMSYGTLEDWRLVKKVYGLQTIKEIVLQIRNLDDFSLAYLSTIFSTPKEEFRCYIQKQSSQSFWNY